LYFQFKCTDRRKEWGRRTRRKEKKRREKGEWRQKEEGRKRREEEEGKREGGRGELKIKKIIVSLSLFFTFHRHLHSGQEFLSISIHPFLLSFPPFPFRTPVLFLFTHVHTHTSLHTNTHMYK